MALTCIYVPAQEPPKAALLEYEASGRQGRKPPRQAACIVQLPAEPGAAVVETVVDLSSPSPAIITWDRVSTSVKFFLNSLHAYYPCGSASLQGVARCVEQ